MVYFILGIVAGVAIYMSLENLLSHISDSEAWDCDRCMHLYDHDAPCTYCHDGSRFEDVMDGQDLD